MDELQQVFTDFENQVHEIASHANQVSKVNFKAELKNGTSFNFIFNADSFARRQGNQSEGRPLSISNAIVDIVGASAAITLLLVLLLIERRTEITLLLSYALFISYFTLSAMFHFFRRESRTHMVFYYLKETSKIISLAMVNIIHIGPLYTLNRSLSLILVALSLLMLSGRTKLSLQVSLALASLLPFISLLGSFSLDTLVRCTLFSLWSCISLAAKSDSRMNSNSIFALIGLLALSIELSPLLLI